MNSMVREGFECDPSRSACYFLPAHKTARRLTCDHAEDHHEKAESRAQKSNPAKNDGDPSVELPFDDWVLLIARKSNESQNDRGDRKQDSKQRQERQPTQVLPDERHRVFVGNDAPSCIALLHIRAVLRWLDGGLLIGIG